VALIAVKEAGTNPVVPPGTVAAGEPAAAGEADPRGKPRTVTAAAECRELAGAVFSAAPVKDAVVQPVSRPATRTAAAKVSWIR
jgi:hypothetical protein